MAKITVDDRDDHDESRYGRLPPRIARPGQPVPRIEEPRGQNHQG
jgi:hypothetical protein